MLLGRGSRHRECRSHGSGGCGSAVFGATVRLGVVIAAGTPLPRGLDAGVGLGAVCQSSGVRCLCSQVSRSAALLNSSSASESSPRCALVRVEAGGLVCGRRDQCACLCERFQVVEDHQARQAQAECRRLRVPQVFEEGAMQVHVGLRYRSARPTRRWERRLRRDGEVGRCDRGGDAAPTWKTGVLSLAAARLHRREVDSARRCGGRWSRRRR